MKKKFDISIIGGGPMGLYLAYLLSKKNYKVRIFETSRTAGGHARPFKFSNTIIEIFYHFFYKNDHYNAMKWISSTKKKNKIHWAEIETEIITNSNKKLNIDNFTHVIKNYRFSSFKIYLNLLIIFIFKVHKKTIKEKAYIWSQKSLVTNFQMIFGSHYL